MSALSFLKTALRDIVNVGDVAPSSSYVIKRVTEALPNGVKTIVEYGPGEGVITKELLKQLPPDGRLLAIELNAEFIEKMKKIKDPRLTVIAGDALRAHEIVQENNMGPVDAVVSGIPFTFSYFFIPNKVKMAIVESTRKLLRPKGVFIQYQSSLLMKRFLKEHFSISFVYEPRNFPPYFIIRAERKD